MDTVIADDINEEIALDNGKSNLKSSVLTSSRLSLSAENGPNLKSSVLTSSRLSLRLNTTNETQIPDGGYGWVVVFATFLIYAIAEGISFAFGLLYVDFLIEFKASKSATSWIGSLFVALPLVSGPICSALVDKYGCQKVTLIGSTICALGFVLSCYVDSIGLLYLTYGVIGGLARGVCYVTVVVSVAFWFEKKRSVALGISASGTGFGTIIFAPFTSFLLVEYGWRGTVLILGGCLFNMSVCGALMIDPKWVKEEEIEKKKEQKRIRENGNIELKELNVLLDKEESQLDKEETQSINNQERITTAIVKPKKWSDPLMNFLSSFTLFTELHFFLLSLTTLLAATWFLIPYFYLADHMIANNYTQDQASLALSVIGFMNIIGMVLLGWIGDRWSVAKAFAISLVMCGVSIWAIMFFTNSYILIVISSGSFGFFFSSCFSLTPSLLGQLVDMDDFTMGYGLILLCEGTGHLIGPPLAGYISDISNSWSQSFYQAGAWIIVAGLAVGIIPFTRNRKLLGKRTH